MLNEIIKLMIGTSTYHVVLLFFFSRFFAFFAVRTTRSVSGKIKRWKGVENDSFINVKSNLDDYHNNNNNKR